MFQTPACSHEGCLRRVGHAPVLAALPQQQGPQAFMGSCQGPKSANGRAWMTPAGLDALTACKGDPKSFAAANTPHNARQPAHP